MYNPNSNLFIDELDDLLRSIEESPTPAKTQLPEPSADVVPTCEHTKTSLKEIKLNQHVDTSQRRLPDEDMLLAPFPVMTLNDLAETDDPRARMDELLDELAEHGIYTRVRKELCCLAIQLNLEGKLAPAFRTPIYTGREKGNPVFYAIHRDQIVIDCHWLHATGQSVRLSSKDRELKPLFNPKKPFDFQMAWNFAQERWTAQHRVVETMRLTIFQQCQLTALRSVDAAVCKDAIHKKKGKGREATASLIATFEQGLATWCERDRRIIKHRDSYRSVWMARQLLGEGVPVRQIGDLAALISGQDRRDDSTTRDREMKIKKNIMGT